MVKEKRKLLWTDRTQMETIRRQWLGTHHSEHPLPTAPPCPRWDVTTSLSNHLKPSQPSPPLRVLKYTEQCFPIVTMS